MCIFLHITFVLFQNCYSVAYLRFRHIWRRVFFWPCVPINHLDCRIRNNIYPRKYVYPHKLRHLVKQIFPKPVAKTAVHCLPSMSGRIFSLYSFFIFLISNRQFCSVSVFQWIVCRCHNSSTTKMEENTFSLVGGCMTSNAKNKISPEVDFNRQLCDPPCSIVVR